MTNLEAALSYLQQGLSVVPMGKGKRPLVPWKQYQERLPTEDEVRGFWKLHPEAGVGFVTGKVSGISVVDFDLYKTNAVQIPECLYEIETPTASTPRGGRHYYFAYDPRLEQGADKASDGKGLDVRNDGGCIMAPPTVNGAGCYKWIIPFSRDFLCPAPPALLSLLLNKASFYKSNNNANISDSYKSQHLTTNANIDFSEGSRDEALFHLANHLVKGKMPVANIEQYLRFFADHCNPPFPQSEINAKIESALKRANDRSVNLTQEVKDLIMTTKGNFMTTYIYNCLHLTTREEKKTVSVILSRLVKDGVIESVKKNAGHYRIIDKDCEEIDYLSASEEPLPILMPLKEHELVEILPGNIILIAGEPNAGKSSWLFNLVKLNMHRFDVHYFNSEMSKEELRKRLLNFDEVKINEWKWHIYERADNFADVIKPGRGKINIIDYLEIYEDFWEIGKFINDIHKKLDGAVAVIAIQKNPGVNTGLGGFRTLEKPRLALAISHGRMDIVKAKNWKTPENPNNKHCEFKILKGGHMYATSVWKRD